MFLCLRLGTGTNSIHVLIIILLRIRQYCHHVFILEIEGVLELDCPRYKYKRRKRNILTLLNSADVPVVYQTFLIKTLPSLDQL